mmetsp:Transcript_73261/g.158576  ORF Transcript_73261/g.158576 Transcript_73261/m.158576 type:complete len:653 (+) Transcript_73261:298-2256(+)
MAPNEVRRLHRGLLHGDGVLSALVVVQAVDLDGGEGQAALHDGLHGALLLGLLELHDALLLALEGHFLQLLDLFLRGRLGLFPDLAHPGHLGLQVGVRVEDHLLLLLLLVVLRLRHRGLRDILELAFPLLVELGVGHALGLSLELLAELLEAVGRHGGDLCAALAAGRRDDRPGGLRRELVEDLALPRHVALRLVVHKRREVRRRHPAGAVGRNRDLAAQVETVEDPLRLHVLAARLRLDALGWPVDHLMRDLLAGYAEGRARAGRGARSRAGAALPAHLLHAAAQQREVDGLQRDLAVDEHPQPTERGLHPVRGCELLLHLLGLLILAEVSLDARGDSIVGLHLLLQRLFPRLAGLPHLHLQRRDLGAGGVLDRVPFGRVGQTQLGVEPKVHKLDHGPVELEEGQHHAEVDLRRELLRELVGGKPRDRLPTDLGLEVVALDRREDLAQRLGADHVELELLVEPRGLVDRLRRDVALLVRGQGLEEGEHADGVVHVADGHVERRVPLADEVVQGVGGLPLLERRGQAALFPAHEPLELLHEGLHVEELVQQRLVREEGDVLGVVVRLVHPGRLLLRVARVDAFQDAKAAEVRKRDLQLRERLGTGHIRRGLALLSLSLPMDLVALLGPLLVPLGMGMLLRHWDLTRGLPATH